MAKLDITAGSTGVMVDVFIQASTSTAGLGLAALTHATTNLTCYYHRPTDGTATPITLATATAGTWVSGGFIELDATNMAGFYQLSIPDAVLGTGANTRSVSMMLKGAAAMAPLPLEVALTQWNNQSATVVLAPQTHTSAVIPIVQTASVATLSAGVHTGAIVPIIQTASVLPNVTLAAAVHTGAIIPIIQTASVLPNVTLAAAVHTGAIIPIVQTASGATLSAGVHTGAIIPVIQTASVLPNVTLAAAVHTGAIIPIVQTASRSLTADTVGTATTVLSVDTVKTSTVTDFTSGALARYFDLDSGQYSTSSAQSVVKQIADNAIGAGGAPTVAQITTAVWEKFGTGTVALAAQVHTGAIIPIVQTASVLPTVTLAAAVHTGAIIPIVQTASVLPNVTLAAAVHTGAIIPVVQTASVLPAVTLAAAVHTGAIIPVVQTASVLPAVVLTAGERTTLATVIGTSSQVEAYRGTGAGGSVVQMLYELVAHHGEMAIIDTTKTTKKIDGSTPAMTFGLDDSTAPTSVTRLS